MPSLVFDTSASGNTTVIPADPSGNNRTIEVQGMIISSLGNVVVTLQDSAGTPTVFTKLNVTTTTPYELECNRLREWYSAPGAAINLNLSAAIRVIGSITYNYHN